MKLNVRRSLPVLCLHIEIQQRIRKHELYLIHRKESAGANQSARDVEGKDPESHGKRRREGDTKHAVRVQSRGNHEMCWKNDALHFPRLVPSSD
jgi:hypothetical protein